MEDKELGKHTTRIKEGKNIKENFNKTLQSKLNQTLGASHIQTELYNYGRMGRLLSFISLCKLNIVKVSDKCV